MSGRERVRRSDVRSGGRPGGRATHRQAPLAPHHQRLLDLQRSAGNAAVVKLIARERSVQNLVDANPRIVAHDDPAEVEAGHAEGAAGPVATAGAHLHIDNEAAALADGLDAEAVTWNRNIYFGTNRYQPGTPQGDRLLRHELAHADGHASDAAHLKPITRQLDFMVIKKVPIGIHKELFGRMLAGARLKGAAASIRPPEGQADGGHWWVELGVRGSQGSFTPLESYGWWPQDLGRGEAKPLKVWEVLKLKKVQGQLNQGHATMDPHHGEPAPVVLGYRGAPS